MDKQTLSERLSLLFSRRSVRFLSLGVSALLTGLCLVIPKIGLIEWLTLVPCMLFLLTVAPKRREEGGLRLRGLYVYGLFFFTCFYIVNFHWFVNLYPLDFIDGMTKGAAVAVVAVAWIGLSVFQAVQSALTFVLAGLALRTRLCRRHGFLSPFVLGGLWVICEWYQTVGWWGTPWGRLPLGQSEYLVGLQTASLLGSYFVTFMLVVFNALVAFVLLRQDKLRLGCAAAATVLVFQYGVGTALWLTNKDKGEPVRMAAIQGNISSHDKWSADSTKKTLDVYAKYTSLASEEGAKVVVWPETALPYTVEEGNYYYAYASSLAKKTGTVILVGAFSESEDEGETREYNSIFCFLPDGTAHETVYSKRRLVPFGEFVPMRGLFETVVPPLAELVMSGEDVLAGEGAQVFALDGEIGGNIGSLICFDSIYEGLSRESVLGGANIICLSTNDSWFTDSKALYMHNAQAQLRAIETDRYIVRLANTGISTVINSRGEVIEALPPLVDGMAQSEVYLSDSTTLYSLVGNIFVYLWMLAVVLLLTFELYLRIRDRKSV